MFLWLLLVAQKPFWGGFFSTSMVQVSRACPVCRRAVLNLLVSDVACAWCQVSVLQTATCANPLHPSSRGVVEPCVSWGSARNVLTFFFFFASLESTIFVSHNNNCHPACSQFLWWKLHLPLSYQDCYILLIACTLVCNIEAKVQGIKR